MSDSRRHSHATESIVVVFVAFAVLVALKWPVLTQLPVWDEAFSVHPAAITLAHNGFDLWALLHEPSYAEGGPNVHAASLVTMLTASGYRWLEGSPWLFPLLHVCHLAIAAWCIAAAYRFGREQFGALLAAIFAAAVFCFPLFQVQAGLMYLETPLLAATLSALTAWSAERRNAALAWAVVAVLVKETGVLVGGVLAFGWLLESRTWSQRLRWALAGTLVPGFIALALLLVIPTPGGAGYRPPPYGVYLRYYLADRLMQVPDLCFFLLATLVVGGLRWKTVLRGFTAVRAAVDGAEDVHLSERRLAIAHLLTLVFLAFHLAAPFVFENYLLPRYLLQILPFMFMALIDALRQATSGRSAYLVTAACCVVFFANREGYFYPRGMRNDFSVAERSEAYRDLLAVQRAGVRTLAESPRDVPVFYGLPEHYFTRYPPMGYVSEVPANGHCLLLEAPYKQTRLEDFPEHFFLLYDYAFLGGLQVLSLLEQARNDPNREVLVAGHYAQGDYDVILFEVRPRLPASHDEVRVGNA
jgi:hypothetical protein